MGTVRCDTPLKCSRGLSYLKIIWRAYIFIHTHKHTPSGRWGTHCLWIMGSWGPLTPRTPRKRKGSGARAASNPRVAVRVPCSVSPTALSWCPSETLPVKAAKLPSSLRKAFADLQLKTIFKKMFKPFFIWHGSIGDLICLSPIPQYLKTVSI